MTDPSPSSAPPLADGPAQAGWPAGSAVLAEQIQRMLSIGDRDWHAHKRLPARRAGEQLATALVVLLSRDAPQQMRANPAREEVIALLEQAIGWLKGELRDPGCPSHGRGNVPNGPG